MSTMTETNMAQDYADTLAETLSEVVAAIESGEEYEGQDAREYLDEMPLEFVSEKGEPFSILLTCGGPTAEIVWSGRSGPDHARLESYWGGDKGYRSSGAIRYVANYFSELMEADTE